jgi:hypothetical protein
MSVLEALRAAVDELAAVDPGALSDAELGTLLVELRRLENRIDHEAARLTGAWDARKAWAADRARTGASWLAHRTRMPHPTARRRVRLGRCLREMPAADAAWAAGDIDAAHLSTHAATRTPRVVEAFERDEALLVEKARTLRFDDFARVTTYWAQLADPDGVEQDARDVHARRTAHLSQTFGGAWVGDLFLDPIGGTILHDTWHGIEKELFDTDWAAARARLGARTDGARPRPHVRTATRRCARRDGHPRSYGAEGRPAAGGPCSRCSWVSRRSPAGCASSPAAPPSAPGVSSRGSTRPTSSASCSLLRHG